LTFLVETSSQLDLKDMVYGKMIQSNLFCFAP
jgi:hypothetical protein